MASVRTRTARISAATEGASDPAADWTEADAARGRAARDGAAGTKAAVDTFVAAGMPPPATGTGAADDATEADNGAADAGADTAAEADAPASPVADGSPAAGTDAGPSPDASSVRHTPTGDGARSAVPSGRNASGAPAASATTTFRVAASSEAKRWMRAGSGNGYASAASAASGPRAGHGNTPASSQTAFVAGDAPACDARSTSRTSSRSARGTPPPHRRPRAKGQKTAQTARDGTTQLGFLIRTISLRW